MTRRAERRRQLILLVLLLPAAVSIAAPTSEHYDLGWMAINSGSVSTR